MRKILFGLLGLLLLLGLAGAVALWQLDVNQYRSEVQAALSKALDRPVVIDSLSHSLLPLRATAHGIRIAEDPAFGDDDFLRAEALRFAIAWWPLLIDRELRVDSIEIEAPSLQLRQDRRGVWNVNSLWQHPRAPSADAAGTDGAASRRLQLSVQKLALRDGELALHRAGDQVRRYRDLQLQASELSADAAFPFALSAQLPGEGAMHLSGRVGPLNQAEPLRSALQATIEIDGAQLAESGWAGDGDQVGGRVSLQFELLANEGVLQSDGRIDAGDLRLLGAEQASEQPIGLSLSSRYDLIQRRGTIEQGVLSAGSAEIELRGALASGDEALQLNLQLVGQAVPVDQLQALMPAFGIQLPERSRLSGGELSLNLSLAGPLDRLEIEGPIELHNTRLDGFSLGARLSALSALAGLPAPKDTRIEHGSIGFYRGPQGMRFEPIEITVAELGQVSGAGQVDSAGDIGMQLLIKIDPEVAERAGQGAGSLGRFSGGAIRYASSRGLDVRIAGSLASPEIRLRSSSVAATVLSGLLAPDESEADSEQDDRRSDRERVGAALLQLLDKQGRSDKRDRDRDQDQYQDQDQDQDRDQ